MANQNTMNQGGNFPLDDLCYDLITVIHKKSKALEAYDKYMRDAQNDNELRQLLEQIRQQDMQQVPDRRDGLLRMRDLPAHHQHQEKAEEQKKQRRNAVLNADDLMIGGENVFAPETELFVLGLMYSRMRDGVRGCLHISVYS